SALGAPLDQSASPRTQAAAQKVLLEPTGRGARMTPLCPTSQNGVAGGDAHSGPRENRAMDFRSQVTNFANPRPADADPWVVKPVIEPVDLMEHDAYWPEQAHRLAAQLRSLLGLRALRVEHVGSTAVPGLPAKPVIDLNVT